MNKNSIDCFKKSNKNIKDYIPSCVKEINIREQKQIKFPEESTLEYSPLVIPNTPFEEWPSEEEVKNHNFISENIFNDEENNLLIFPYSLRKETFNNIIWERPNEIIKQQNLIKLIKKELPESNFDYISKKINYSSRNINTDLIKRNSIDFSETSKLVNELTEMKLNLKEKKINKKISELQNEITIINNEKKEPSNINMKRYYCNYLKWIASLYQVIIDNNINNKDFIKRIYPQNEEGIPIYNPSGKYWIKLFQMGKFRKIEIDDKFPCDKKTYEIYLPQCDNINEIWPMILTKAIIKMYSYKYRNEYYENEEIGDLSPFYALTGYFGFNINNNVILSLINENKQKFKKSDDFENGNEEEEIENNEIDDNYFNDDNISEDNKIMKDYIKTLLCSNNDNVKNSILIGFHPSKDYLQSEKDNNYKSQKYIYSESIKRLNNHYLNNKNNVISTNKSKNNNSLNNNNNNNTINNRTKKNRLLTGFRKNNLSNISSIELPDIFASKHFKYFSPLQSNERDTIIITKTNKKLKNGIYCDIAYSIIELFQNGTFNLQRLKPIPFNDLKLHYNIKFKQMNTPEKKNYLAQLKDLRKKQKAELHIRLRKYRSDGNNIFLFKISNHSLDYSEINTFFNDREIQTAKYCILNNKKYPSLNYFKNTFLNDVWKDEETGEINFWTQNFYLKLLYCEKKKEEKEKKELNNNEENENEKEKTQNNIKKTENINDNKKEEEKKIDENKIEENKEEKNKNKDIESINYKLTGAWLTCEDLIESFTNYSLFNNMKSFKNYLFIDNIWYDYKTSLYEEKETSTIIYIKPNLNEESKDKKNIQVNNEENENLINTDSLYIVFEPNCEKNKRSISSNLPYQIIKENNKVSKFDSVHFSLVIEIYYVNKETKKITKIENDNKIILKQLFSVYEFNLSKENEYFMIIKGGLTPFGYTLQFFSNTHQLENYSYSQFLLDFKKYNQKIFTINHPILPKNVYYLFTRIQIKFDDKKTNNKEKEKDKNIENEENKNKIVKFYSDFIEFENKTIKNCIDIFLINGITNHKKRIFTKQFIDLNFEESELYYIEMSLIPPYNIPENKINFTLLFNNPNIITEQINLIAPYYIKEKFIPNKYSIVFEEILFATEIESATLDISIEYRPKINEENSINENDKENNINNNNNNDELPPIQKIPHPINMLFEFSIGDKKIFEKYFVNHTLIRNLELKGEIYKSSTYKNLFEIPNLYKIKCILDPYVNPSYLLNIDEYTHDFYWNIGIFSSEPIQFVKNTLKEDFENHIKLSWEENEPGRAEKAKLSRKKYFVKQKYENGEMLEPDEDELIFGKNKNVVIESDSKLLVTKIPKSNNNNNNNSQNINNNKMENKKESINLNKKYLPTIDSYNSLFMKNFYMYSIQDRVIVQKQLNINSKNILVSNSQSLPKINNINCKSDEQRENDKKNIEGNYNNYYQNIENNKKKYEENIKKYENQIIDLNKKLIEKRKKVKTAFSNNRKSLKDVIEKNNKINEKFLKLKNIEIELKNDENIDIPTFNNLYKELKDVIDIKNIKNEYKRICEYVINKLSEIKKKHIVNAFEKGTKNQKETLKKLIEDIKDNILIIDESIIIEAENIINAGNKK